ncbi:MAG: hypothetical protein U1F43_19620 [Myxococcota bacterium]
MASILAQLSDLRVTTESGVTAEADTVDVTTEASTKLGSDESLKSQGPVDGQRTAVQVTY